MLPLKKILCPTDFSEASYQALDHAIELAAHFNAELYLLHVVPFLADPAYSPAATVDFIGITEPQTDTERLALANQTLKEVATARVPSALTTHYEVKMGYADKEIAAAAEEEDFDLLVIATHGLTGWRHLVFGSTAEAIVRQSRCPVLTIHATPPENSTPPA